MKTRLKLILLVWMVVLLQGAQAQNWQLVWSDEFTSGISPDWVFETGAGGWGNNELQYYRRENATVQNGQLLITAKREAFGGANYTSARMKTQGKKSWKYGKIEARIAMPNFQGIWPAFWMLGDNISSVGWPKCGEIDIMEHVNTGNEVVGTIHWDNNGHVEYGGRTNADNSLNNFHTYSVEWNSNEIKWFVDGRQYHTVNIKGGVNGTEEMHNNYFILLNLAVGGNWPGFNIDNNGFPTSMLVDYVRVYQDNGTPVNPGVTNLSGSYQLQNRFSGMFLDVDAASTADGARIQQWTATGCTCQNFKFTHLGSGVYEITADHSGKSLDVSAQSTADGAAIVQWPYWGGTNQKFKVVSTGDGYYKIMPTNSGKLIEVGGWSTTPGGIVQQWSDAGQTSGQWKLVPVGGATFTKTIQAESYSAMLGVQIEATTDAGGGSNVGYIDAGDWMAYNSINFPSSGTYKIEYRAASVSGSKLSLDLNAGAIQLGVVNIPATGGWQTWTTVSQTVNVNAGTYNLGLYAQAGGWNINWIKITKVSGAKVGLMDDVSLDVTPNYNLGTTVEIYPNPIEGELRFVSGTDLAGATAKIVDAMGNEVISTVLDSDKIDVSFISAGIYTMVINKDGNSFTKRFIKK